MNKTFQGVYVNPYQLGIQLEAWLAGKGYKTQIFTNKQLSSCSS